MVINSQIIPLERITIQDAHRVGNKAAICGELLRSGFPVPPGACLSAAVYQQALAQFQSQLEAVLQAHDLILLEGVGQAAFQIEVGGENRL